MFAGFSRLYSNDFFLFNAQWVWPSNGCTKFFSFLLASVFFACNIALIKMLIRKSISKNYNNFIHNYRYSFWAGVCNKVIYPLIFVHIWLITLQRNLTPPRGYGGGVNSILIHRILALKCTDTINILQLHQTVIVHSSCIVIYRNKWVRIPSYIELLYIFFFCRAAYWELNIYQHIILLQFAINLRI